MEQGAGARSHTWEGEKCYSPLLTFGAGKLFGKPTLTWASIDLAKRTKYHGARAPARSLHADPGPVAVLALTVAHALGPKIPAADRGDWLDGHNPTAARSAHGLGGESRQEQ